MCKIYYSKTIENDFEDNNLDKIPKKRKNENYDKQICNVSWKDPK